MLRVPEWTLYVNPISLSEKVLLRCKQKIFWLEIGVLNRKHQDSIWFDWKWAHDQIPFSPETVRVINRYLRRFWLMLSEKYRDSNVLICYRYVGEHNDFMIKWKNGKPDFHVWDQSLTFIPIFWHEWASFSLNCNSQPTFVDIEDGTIVTFDHNRDHKVDFPVWKYTWKLKFWLSFFLDRIDQSTTLSPPSALSHPQDPLSP